MTRKTGLALVRDIERLRRLPVSAAPRRLPAGHVVFRRGERA